MRVGWVMWLQSGPHPIKKVGSASKGALTLEEEVGASIRQLWTTSELGQNGSYRRRAEDDCWARSEMEVYPRVRPIRNTHNTHLHNSCPKSYVQLYFKN